MIIINYFSPEIQNIITSSAIQPQVREISAEKHLALQNDITEVFQKHGVDLSGEIALLCSRLSALFVGIHEYNRSMEETKPGKLDPKKVN